MKNEIDIYDIEANPTRGLERFLNMKISITDKVVFFEIDKLDKVGKREFRKYVTENFIAVVGLASISWKSKKDRNKCILDQTKRSRWKKVEAYRDLIINGKWDKSKQGPTYIHPSFTNSIDNKLRPIDGARRIMAYIEANVNCIEVNIIKKCT